MRRNAKVDDNQASIVRALRSAGKGCPDLLVYRADTLSLLEIKDGSKIPSRRKLTPLQVEFHKQWPVHVVNDIDEALKAVGLT
jgi:hypothetical protein